MISSLALFSADSLLVCRCPPLPAPGSYTSRRSHLPSQGSHPCPRKAAAEPDKPTVCTRVYFLGQWRISLTRFCHILLHFVTLLSLAGSGCPARSAV